MTLMIVFSMKTRRCHWKSISVANFPWQQFSQIWIWKIKAKFRLAMVHSKLEFMMALKETASKYLLSVLFVSFCFRFLRCFWFLFVCMHAYPIEKTCLVLILALWLHHDDGSFCRIYECFLLWKLADLVKIRSSLGVLIMYCHWMVFFMIRFKTTSCLTKSQIPRTAIHANMRHEYLPPTIAKYLLPTCCNT